jgi:uncharacterized protein (TIGR02172 family)
MKLDDYRTQFRKNMMVMSRTANGNLDLSASATKADSMEAKSAEDAQKLALENTDKALEFLYNNREREFKSAKELEELILEAARITNHGIVKEGSLFRNGQDSTKYPYARIADLPMMWEWFINNFYWMLSSNLIEPERTAAMCEYIINVLGHFFSDGCGKISMLVSTYVFMREDLRCPKYTSREEFYRAAYRKEVPTLKVFLELPIDPEFRTFLAYYLTLCSSDYLEHYYIPQDPDTGGYVCYLIGNQAGLKDKILKEDLESFYKEHGDVEITFDCENLQWIDLEGLEFFEKLRTDGRHFVLQDVNADCTVIFKVKGLEDCLAKKDKLPQIDLSQCEKLNEGANGVIYKVSDEIVAKTFKNDPNYFDIVRQRLMLRNALICGVPAPISFGYALYNDQIVTLMEMIHSQSLIQIFASSNDIDKYVIAYAQFVKQLHEIRDEKKLTKFMRDLIGQEILEKSDRCDRVLPDEYKGRARKFFETMDEPECLVHGDIQPNNIMFSNEEMLFIDFDSFSTGKSIYDLGGLYRTLLCNENLGVSNLNAFLKIPFDQCRRIWEMFVDEYYKDLDDQTKAKKIAQAEMFGTVLTLAKHIKNKADDELINRWVSRLENLEDKI